MKTTPIPSPITLNVILLALLFVAVVYIGVTGKMERRRLQGIQERAEGQFRAEWLSESEILLWLAAFVGFLIAGGMLVFRSAWRLPAILTGAMATITLFLAFAQPPLWADVLGVLLVYAGLVWSIRPAGKPGSSLRHSQA